MKDDATVWRIAALSDECFEWPFIECLSLSVLDTGLMSRWTAFTLNFLSRLGSESLPIAEQLLDLSLPNVLAVSSWQCQLGILCFVYSFASPTNGLDLQDYVATSELRRDSFRTISIRNFPIYGLVKPFPLRVLCVWPVWRTDASPSVRIRSRATRE